MITADELLQCCRRNRKMTLRQVAEKAGVSVTMLHLWERGKHEPRFNAVLYCLDAMGFELVLKEKDGTD